LDHGTKNLMKNNAFKIEKLLGSFPNDTEEILSYLDKVKKYSGECGCSLGAKFLVVSLGIFVIYFFAFNDFELANILKTILFGILFIFTSSIVGKLVGIWIARIRLALLYKFLIVKYQIQGE
jgi:hypothetical protein